MTTSTNSEEPRCPPTWRVFGTWLVLAFLTVCNGALREVVLVRVVKRPLAEALSAVSGIAIILSVTRRVLRPFAGSADVKPERLAFTWTSLTVAFELVFGHYVDHKSWSELLGNYALWKG